MQEAKFEFEGGMDYEDIAVFSKTGQILQFKEELKLWSMKLQSEALLSATTVTLDMIFLKAFQFLTAALSTSLMESFISDHCILQSLVDLTNGKKLNDMANDDKFDRYIFFWKMKL